MLRSEKVLFALNDAENDDIERTSECLGYRAKRRIVQPRKALRVLLIAAILSVLFLTTAYAAGWLGVGGLKKAQLFGMPVVTVEGLAESPEGQGTAAWLDYYELHKGDAFDPEEAYALLQEGYGAYGATTREMAHEIDRLCQQYGLRKLGTMEATDDEKAYYEAAGIGKLTRNTKETENDFYAGYYYDSGSFQYDGALFPSGKNYSLPYQFRRAAKGTLGYVAVNLGSTEGFDEWNYRTEDGAELGLANREDVSLMLYDDEQSFVMVLIPHNTHSDFVGDGVIDGMGDEPVTVTLTRSELENLAESFRWAALKDPRAGMDETFTKHAYAERAAEDFLPVDVDLSMIPEAWRYPASAVYTQQIAPYVKDFRLVDYSLDYMGNSVAGWMLFKAEAKTALPWQKIPSADGDLYCRSLNVHKGGENGSWIAEPGFDMLPYPEQSDTRNIGTAENPDFVWLGTELGELTSASLYVQQTGKTYTLDTPEALEELRAMLQYNQVAETSACPDWNPLYLSFTDGSHSTVYTAADGSDSVRIYGNSQRYGLGVSLFELFGVPLQAEGYSEQDGVVTARLEYPGSDFVSWVEIAYQKDGPAIARRAMSDMLREARYEYDEQSRIVRETWWEGATMTVEQTWTYREDGRLLRWDSSFGNRWETVSYEYDAQGRLTAEIHRDNDDLPGATGGNFYYRYDENGHCRRTMG